MQKEIEILIHRKRFDEAWKLIQSHCFEFIEDYEWYKYVNGKLSYLDSFLENEIEAEDFFFFSDNYTRLSIKNIKEFNQLESILWKNKEILDSHLIMKNQESLLRNPERRHLWNEMKLEYLSRHYLYYSQMRLKQVDLKNLISEENRVLIHSAMSSLLLSLSYLPEPPEDLLYQLSYYQRVGIAGRSLLGILCCFNYEWLMGIQSEVEEDDQDFQFQPILYQDIELGSDSLPPKMLEILLRVKKLADSFDQTMVFLPFDLNSVLSIAYWRIMDNQLKVHLRKIFPKIPEHPPMKSLKNTILQPSLTSIEIFIKNLLKQKWEYFTEILFPSHSFTQILFCMCQEMYWQPSKEHLDFWHFLLYHYGSPSLIQREYYGPVIKQEGDDRKSALRYQLKCKNYLNEKLKDLQSDSLLIVEKENLTRQKKADEHSEDEDWDKEFEKENLKNNQVSKKKVLAEEAEEDWDAEFEKEEKKNLTVEQKSLPYKEEKKSSRLMRQLETLNSLKKISLPPVQSLETNNEETRTENENKNSKVGSRLQRQLDLLAKLK